MLFVALLEPPFGDSGLPMSSRVRQAAELVQAAGPLVAFLILSTRSDVLRLWGLKKQESSMQAMQDVNREKVFRKTSRASMLESQRLEENRSNETQIPSESPDVSLEQEHNPYNPSFASAESVTCSVNISKLLPAIPKSER